MKAKKVFECCEIVSFVAKKSKIKFFFVQII